MKYILIRYISGQLEVLPVTHDQVRLPNRRQGFWQVEALSQSSKWLNLDTIASLTIYEPAPRRAQRVFDIGNGVLFAGLFVYTALMARGKFEIGLSIAALALLATLQMIRRNRPTITQPA